MKIDSSILRGSPHPFPAKFFYLWTNFLKQAGFFLLFLHGDRILRRSGWRHCSVDFHFLLGSAAVCLYFRPNVRTARSPFCPRFLFFFYNVSESPQLKVSPFNRFYVESFHPPPQRRLYFPAYSRFPNGQQGRGLRNRALRFGFFRFSPPPFTCPVGSHARRISQRSPENDCLPYHLFCSIFLSFFLF